MRYPNTLEVAQVDLFTSKDELEKKYDSVTVNRLLRLRDMYAWTVANPDGKDREFVDTLMARYGTSQRQAYADLHIVKMLLPMISSASRDFHRWRANEMLLETYRIAKKRKDTKTMERAAASYAKYNRVDLEDEQALPFDEIVVQPFTATSDPSVLGIKPIPNLKEKIRQLIDKYRKETIDIDDVDFEEVDLELDTLYPLQTQPKTITENNGSLL